MAGSNKTNYVVSGAKTICNGRCCLDRTVTFISRDRGISIGRGNIGTEADTSPQDNFDDNYGPCKFLNGSCCIPNFLPVWFNTAETVLYSKLNLLLKEYQNACNYAIQRARQFFLICETDFSHRETDEEYKEYKTELQNSLNLRELTAKKFRGLQSGIAVMEEWRKNGTIDFYRIQSFSQAIENLNSMVEVLQEYKKSAPSIAQDKRQMAHCDHAIAYFTRAKAILTQITDNENVEEKIILQSSILVCRRGGVITFINDGQDFTPIDSPFPQSLEPITIPVDKNVGLVDLSNYIFVFGDPPYASMFIPKYWVTWTEFSQKADPAKAASEAFQQYIFHENKMLYPEYEKIVDSTYLAYVMNEKFKTAIAAGLLGRELDRQIFEEQIDQSLKYDSNGMQISERELSILHALGVDSLEELRESLGDNIGTVSNLSLVIDTPANQNSVALLLSAYVEITYGAETSYSQTLGKKKTFNIYSSVTGHVDTETSNSSISDDVGLEIIASDNSTFKLGMNTSGIHGDGTIKYNGVAYSYSVTERVDQMTIKLARKETLGSSSKGEYMKITIHKVQVAIAIISAAFAAPVLGKVVISVSKLIVEILSQIGIFVPLPI